AERGGERAHSVLRMCGVDERSADRVRAMVARHERRRIDREVCLVNDADGLSFFSLNSPGYVAYFGATQTRRKVAYTLARLGRRALRELERVRLCPTIARFVAEVAP
ncbi:MAG TPA: DUF4202 family protein, partial [Labilithrix sp.]|nr:DUF4202 family protein [Labilithrix sp.]